MKAFPSTTPLYSPEKGTMIGRQEHGGMELRDWFAGKALVVAIQQPNDYYHIDQVFVATWCYEMADAMMEAKNAKTKE